MIGILFIVKGLQPIIDALKAGQGNMGDFQDKSLQKILFRIVRQVKKNLTAGKPLNVRSGRLRGSIASKITRRGGGGRTAEGVVGSNVIYAAVHEQGKIIRAKGAGMLKFMDRGKFYSVRQVIIPERPYFWPAIEKSGAFGDRLIRMGLKRLIETGQV